MNNKILKLEEFLFARPLEQVVAIDGRGRIRTRKNLRSDTARLLKTLLGAGGSRCVLVFEDSYLFAVALLACLYARKIPVLLGTHQLSRITQHSCLYDVVLTDSRAPQELGGTVIVVDAAERADVPLPEERLRHISLAGSWIRMYTSGSTGANKEVKKYIRDLNREAVFTCTHFGERLKDCLLCSSIYPNHLYGLTFRIFMPLALGVTFYAGLVHYTEQLCGIRGEPPLAFVSSPAFLKRVDTALKSPELRFILSAGGRLDFDCAQSICHWSGCHVDEIFGSTESGVIAWRCNDSEGRLWHLFDDIEIEERPDVFVLKSPLVTVEGGGEFLLDDRVRMHGTREFELLGRIDQVVKLEDIRISLDEVRHALLSFEGVSDCEVVPLEKGNRTSLGALLVLNPLLQQRLLQECGEAYLPELERRLKRWLQNRIDALAVPRYFLVVKEIPVNQLNKRVVSELQRLFYAPS